MRDRLVVLREWRGIGGRAAEFSEGPSGECDAVRVVDQAVQDGVAESGIADAFVPVLDGHLAREERGAPTRPIFNHLQEIAPFAVADGRESPVIKLCGAPHKRSYGKCVVMWSCVLRC